MQVGGKQAMRVGQPVVRHLGHSPESRWLHLRRRATQAVLCFGCRDPWATHALCDRRPARQEEVTHLLRHGGLARYRACLTEYSAVRAGRKFCQPLHQCAVKAQRHGCIGLLQPFSAAEPSKERERRGRDLVPPCAIPSGFLLRRQYDEESRCVLGVGFVFEQPSRRHQHRRRLDLESDRSRLRHCGSSERRWT